MQSHLRRGYLGRPRFALVILAVVDEECSPAEVGVVNTLEEVAALQDEFDYLGSQLGHFCLGVPREK